MEDKWITLLRDPASHVSASDAAGNREYVEKELKLNQKIKPFPAFVLVTVGLLALAHMLATLAFTGPATPLKESLQPGLNKYFLGPLDQGWNLFAPGPYSQDEYMQVRACVSDFDVCSGGSAAGAEFTDWRDVTKEELGDAAGNMFAGRASRISKAVTGRLWSSYTNLTPELQEHVAGNHIDGDVYTDEQFAADPALNTYSRLESAAVGLATLYLREDYGDDVTLVEVRFKRVPVPSFDERHDESATVNESWIRVGWRAAADLPKEAIAAW